MPASSDPPATLILASGSPYRRMLLERLGLAFSICSPALDESRQPGESGEILSRRLAREKAQAIAIDHPEEIVIGSDQVLACKETLFGKPGNHANAVKQLQQLSGQAMTFYTSVCVTQVASGYCADETAITQVQFRDLDLVDIEAYLAAEPAYDCAGSCKAEGLGISLCESIYSDDPTALIGLPLIRLSRLLREVGIRIPAGA